MNVDWTKPILWDGKPARVLATDLKGSAWPVIIAVYEDGVECPCRSTLDGLDGMCDSQRVTNAPERFERWANVYGTCVTSMWGNRIHADAQGSGGRTALVRYVFEDDKLVSAEVVPLEDKP